MGEPHSEPGERAPWEELLSRLEAQSPRESRYRLQGEIGRGGMGAVLRVWDGALHRQLAMKVVLKDGQPSSVVRTPADPRTLSRFLEEAQVTGQLDHPGIVPVHELGMDSQGRVYFTMKLVKGKTLKEVFAELADGAEGWTQARVLGLLLKVCEAMSYAHAKGVIHRDLKPANVMVGRFGEVFVMDWGLAKVLGREESRDIRIQPEIAATSELHSSRRSLSEETPDSPLVTMDGDVVGTPAYMSPEQAMGTIEALGPPSDVYSMGAMLYHLLSGQMPYVPPSARLNNYAIWHRVQEGPPQPLHELAPGAPSELVAICEKAMERDASRRYRDMTELAEDLRAYLEQRVVHAYETGALAELRKWIERNKALASSAAAAVLLLIAGLTVSLVFEARAERKADEVLRLSALQRLDDLVREVDRLWPIAPELVERYQTWLSSAGRLLAELPSHEASLTELRARGRQLPDEGGLVWTFDSTEDRWWHDQLTKLAEGLKAFSDEKTGLFSAGISPEHGWGIRRRLELVGEIAERSIDSPEAKERWTEALASIRDRCAWYVRVELEPQFGLLPIGQDRASGLWEFAHLLSGEPAERRDDGRLFLESRTGLVLVLLPGGRFQMGAQSSHPEQPNHDPAARSNEGPVHPVMLSPFFLSKYEMTQGQWQRVVGENPSSWGPDGLLPVERVSWIDCDELCRRVGLKLPTEAQWEYGARAGTSTPWWSGEEADVLFEVGNLADESYGRGFEGDTSYERWDDGAWGPSRTGNYAANPFGLLDVIGNVWEWCQDWHGLYPVGAEAVVDPVRLDQGFVRVYRGGGFSVLAANARSAVRPNDETEVAGSLIGLRPARALER